MKFVPKASGFAVLALAGLAAFSCGKKKEGGDGSQSSGTSGKPPETGEASTIAMSGTLALTTSEQSAQPAAALTQDAYNLYCVTFEEAPKACKGDIAADGNFGFSCEGFVGRGFGCFLRSGNKTMGTVEFGEDSQMIAGAGKLVFKMVFNPETGAVKATIDVAASSAVSEEALAAFKDFIEQNKTQMADLTGNWEIKPDCSKNAEMCPPDLQGDESFPVHMEQYAHPNGKTYLAMWSDENRKNQCGGSANLSFKVAGAAIDFKSKDSLFEGLRKAMGSLDPALRTKLKELAVARGKKQYGWCENNDSPYKADNCKQVKAELEKHTWYDPDGNPKTETYPKYYSPDEFGNLIDTTGDSIVDVQCSFEWKEGVPGCPWHAKKNADGSGTFKQASAGGVGLMLICKDPHSEQNLIHEPAPGKSLTDSLAAFGNQKPAECEKVADGDFKGEYAAAAREAARAILDMARINPEDGWAKEMCDRYTVPSGFSWSQCSGNHEQPHICWEGQWQRENLNIVVKDGKLVANGDINTDWFNSDEYADICPTAAAAAEQAQSAQNQDMDWQQFAKTYAGQCREEILKKTAAQQAEAFAKSARQWQPLGEILYCDAGTKAAASAVAGSSCVADAHFDYHCGPNGCEEILMCSGSSAGGRCYDDAGNFAGRVAGRDDNMVMKMGIAGAFSMTQSEQDVWRSWDPETNEQQKCVYSRISTMNNLKIDDNAFSGIYASKSKEQCEADKKDGMSLTEGEGGEGGGETMTIPFVATRK